MDKVQLIERVQLEPALWQKSHTDFKNSRLKNRLFHEMAQKYFPGNSGIVLSQTWKSLIGYYRELKKIPKTGSDADVLDRRSSWGYYPFMDIFLSPYYTDSKDRDGNLTVSTQSPPVSPTPEEYQTDVSVDTTLHELRSVSPFEDESSADDTSVVTTESGTNGTVSGNAEKNAKNVGIIYRYCIA